MAKNSLSHRTIRNSIYNLNSLVWPIVFSVIVTPFVIHRVGVAQYGIYTVILVLVSFLGLLDLGISPTLVRAVAELHEKKEYPALYRFINSTLCIYAAVGTVCFVAMLLGARFILTLLKIDSAAQGAATYYVYIAAFMYLVSTFRIAMSPILSGLQRYDSASKILLAGTVLNNVGLLVVAYSSPSAAALLGVQCLATLFLAIMYLYRARQLLPDWKPRLYFDKSTIAPHFSFGGLVFLNQVATTTLLQLDKLILSIFLGPQLVPYYALPGSIGQKSQDVSASLTGAFFPLTSQLSAGGEDQKIAQIYQRTIRMISFIVFGMLLVVFVYAKAILQYWLGGDFPALSTHILIVLELTYFALALFVPLNNFLLGMGKAKALVFVTVCMGIIDLILLLVLLPVYGIVGAAWAYALSVVPLPFFFYFAEKHYLHIQGIGKFYALNFGKSLIISLGIAVLCKYVLMQYVVSLPSLLLMAGFTFGLYSVCYYLCGFFEDEDVALVKSYVGSYIPKR